MTELLVTHHGAVTASGAALVALVMALLRRHR